MPLYEVAIIGDATAEQIEQFDRRLSEAVSSYQLTVGSDLSVVHQPTYFAPDPKSASAVVLFGGPALAAAGIDGRYDSSRIPSIPIASTARRVAAEIPETLQSLNCLLYDKDGPEAIVPAVLGCLGLLPRQRRVFLSYARRDSTAAAIQLFNELSGRKFDVFLDTHSVDVATKFQEELWHQLCDSDVLIMLETEGYFKSRWTMAEYGRALAKGIGVLRVTWPDSTPSVFTETASRAEIVAAELLADGTFTQDAVERICAQLEQVRVTSHAARHISLVDSITNAVNRILGQVTAVGPDRTMLLRLATGDEIAVQPAIGIPTSTTLENAFHRAGTRYPAVVYDHLGIKPSWQAHLNWLAHSIPGARWIKASEASWDFANWRP